MAAPVAVLLPIEVMLSDAEALVVELPSDDDAAVMAAVVVPELDVVPEVIAICWTMIWTYVCPDAADAELVPAVELVLSELVALFCPGPPIA